MLTSVDYFTRRIQGNEEVDNLAKNGTTIHQSIGKPYDLIEKKLLKPEVPPIG